MPEEAKFSGQMMKMEEVTFSLSQNSICLVGMSACFLLNSTSTTHEIHEFLSTALKNITSLKPVKSSANFLLISKNLSFFFFGPVTGSIQWEYIL